MRDLVGDRGRVRLVMAFVVMSTLWFAFSYLPLGLSHSHQAAVLSLIYDGWAVGVGALALGWALGRRHARAWLPLAVATLAMPVGDTVWDLSAHGIIPVPQDTPSLMDLFYLPAYLALGLTVVLLVRRFHPHGLGPLLETMVVAGGAAAAAFPLLVEPYASTIRTGSILSRSIHVLYPVADVTLFGALVVVLFASPQVRVLRMVGLAAGICMVADHIYARQVAADSYTGRGWLDWMWLAQYTLMATAVLSPIPGRAPGQWTNGVVRRTMLLIGATLLCPALLVAVQFGLPIGERDVTEAVYAVGALVLIALVSARLVGLLRENSRTVHDLRQAWPSASSSASIWTTRPTMTTSPDCRTGGC